MVSPLRSKDGECDVREYTGEWAVVEQEFTEQPCDGGGIVAEHTATPGSEDDRRLFERHGGR